MQGKKRYMQSHLDAFHLYMLVGDGMHSIGNSAKCHIVHSKSWLW